MKSHEITRGYFLGEVIPRFVLSTESMNDLKAPLRPHLLLQWHGPLGRPQQAIEVGLTLRGRDNVSWLFGDVSIQYPYTCCSPSIVLEIDICRYSTLKGEQRGFHGNDDNKTLQRELEQAILI